MSGHLPRWDQLPEVVSPVGRMMAEQLAERPRRQPLDGFEPVYSDFVDYIIRCTHRIWEEKNVGLCTTHYGEDCTLHTLAGPTVGAANVVEGTFATLSVYTDRQVVGEDVIWSEDAPGTFYSSHRITGVATHLGDDPLAPARGARVTTTTIADCLVRENRIIEEWLVRDNSAAAFAIGLDPWSVAQQQAAFDRDGDPARHMWRAAWIEAMRASAPAFPPEDHPAYRPALALARAFEGGMPGEATHDVSPAIDVRWPSGRTGIGRGYWVGCLIQLRAALQGTTWRMEHFAARPLPHGDIAVALRWTLSGRHSGAGAWGRSSGRDVLVLAVSHLRLRGGLIVEDVTVFDEIAILRQIAGGLGA